MLSSLLFACSTTKEVKDVDGNVYTTIKIGDQVWMQENLRVTHYQNGDVIPNMANASRHNFIGVFFDYDNKAENGKKYGHLYNWKAVKDKKGLCPCGWHVPSDAEWTTLVNFLGGDNTAGGKLAQLKDSVYKRMNTVGTENLSGFTGIMAGYREQDGKFFHLNNGAFWWSSTEASETGAWSREINMNNLRVVRNQSSKAHGMSVRCIKDTKN